MRHTDSGEQISFIKVYVLRPQAALGLAVPIPEGSCWAHLAGQAHPPSR
ncbi:hypothetical protein [Kutzneria buriramensis]|nr:hypothetical protein [Kutzneria buriramensis]